MMKPIVGFLVVGTMAVLVPPIDAQAFNRHSVTIIAGTGRPRGDLRPFFSDSFLAGGEYGYRFHRNFQVDAGFDTTFGAAGVRDWLPSIFGDLRIRDYQHFIPFGGRVVLPLGEERVHIYGGMGGVYLRYTERIRQPFQGSDIRFPCNVCAARDGFGYYSTVGVTTALDDNRNFRLGVGVKMYRGRTSGDPFGAAPPVETKDQWLNLFGSFSLTF